MSDRNRSGSVVFDRRLNCWNFLWWENGHRHSKRIGTTRKFPTRASAWRAAKEFRHALENNKPVTVSNTIMPMVIALVEQYRKEKMPQRYSTRRSYECWLNGHILPRWGACPLIDLQARPVELWLTSLDLAPKSRAHIRGLVRKLWDFAMWSGSIPTTRNPIELVTVLGASKRMKQPVVS